MEDETPVVFDWAKIEVGAPLFVCEEGKNGVVDGAVGAPKMDDGAVVGKLVLGANIDGAAVGGAKAEVDTLVVDSSSLSMKPPSLFNGVGAEAGFPKTISFGASWTEAPHIV